MAETWFNRPMESSDIQPSDPPVITKCCCKHEFIVRGDVWECPKHGNVTEDEHVEREHLTVTCPVCDSFRVAEYKVRGTYQCFNCYEHFDFS